MAVCIVLGLVGVFLLMLPGHTKSSRTDAKLTHLVLPR